MLRRGNVVIKSAARHRKKEKKKQNIYKSQAAVYNKLWYLRVLKHLRVAQW